jgi:hypothetical protein
MSSSGNRRHQQPHLFIGQWPGALVSVEKCTRWNWITRHPCDR